ncbi:popeye domain-containing protein 1-B isoform X2 [Rhipicephalus microplus]|uniref:popeye domain-containing protein 1-B isoform X2 n=1 Tax=Rhipicephalus microplus TaxID=6941 RepID=UPI003F6AA416
MVQLPQAPVSHSKGSSSSSVYRRSVVNSSLPNVASAAGGCESWEDAQHILWQGAQICFAAAFLVPHRFSLSSLVLRWLLTLSFTLTSIWAGLVVCAPDVLAWHLTCLLVNAAHALRLAWRALPPRMPAHLRTLYERMFLPYQVSTNRFVELTRAAEVVHLAAERRYATEGVTAADQWVSILLTGKLQVTCEDVLLHYVQPNEFIDSPEYESCPIGSEKLFQVTITALEPCTYLTWQRRRLHLLLRANPALWAVVNNLVGRDIALKLYSLAEFHQLGADGVPLPARDASPDWGKQVPRSLSLDAVYTGPEGRLRSFAWHAAREASKRAVDASVATSSHVSSYAPAVAQEEPERRRRVKVVAAAGAANVEA